MQRHEARISLVRVYRNVLQGCGAHPIRGGSLPEITGVALGWLKSWKKISWGLSRACSIGPFGPDEANIG